jgi:hypothetical protein
MELSDGASPRTPALPAIAAMTCVNDRNVSAGRCRSQYGSAAAIVATRGSKPGAAARGFIQITR